MKPTRSTNKTDTAFRSSRAGEVARSFVPHEEQKVALSALSAPHFGHAVTRQAYAEVARRFGPECRAWKTMIMGACRKEDLAVSLPST